MGLLVFDRQQIAAAVRLDDLLEPVRDTLIAYSSGQTQATPIGLLALPERAEVHVKAGYVPSLEVFAVKVATMFPALRHAGAKTSDGAILVCSCATGEPVALLHDRKLLTDLRTAAVGALATDALAPAQAHSITVFGTGGQARLQVLGACLVRSINRVVVWGRDAKRADDLAAGLRHELPAVEVLAEPDAEAAARASEVLITATASHQPLLHGEWLSGGQHITAVGADDLEKRELAPSCFTRAKQIVVDSAELNTRYGDLPAATDTDPSLPARLVELGNVLAGRSPGRESDEDITITKHIGIGVEDAAAAAAALRRLVS